MQKRKLSLDELRVESFETDDPALAQRGTVFARSHRGTCEIGCSADTCYDCQDSINYCDYSQSCVTDQCNLSDFEGDCTWGGRGASCGGEDCSYNGCNDDSHMGTCLEDWCAE